MKDASPGFNAASLVKLHQAGVWRYLRALGCDANLADDLTQETFLWALEHPFQDIIPAATGGYLRKVARSCFINHHRRRGREVVMEQVEVVDAAWTQWGERDGGTRLLEALAECLETVSDRARAALGLRYRDRASRAAIAAALSMSEDGAKNVLQRAKAHLRNCIERKMRTAD